MSTAGFQEGLLGYPTHPTRSLRYHQKAPSRRREPTTGIAATATSIGT